jgi:hypothetical protein
VSFSGFEAQPCQLIFMGPPALAAGAAFFEQETESTRKRPTTAANSAGNRVLFERFPIFLSSKLNFYRARARLV